jgi:hypothetical protein
MRISRRILTRILDISGMDFNFECLHKFKNKKRIGKERDSREIWNSRFQI